MERRNQSSKVSKAVLVVESNSADSKLIRIAAAKACPDVPFHFVTSVDQALAYLQGQSPFIDRAAHPFPNVVLLNLTLPGVYSFGVDGFKLLDCTQRLPECAKLPVLAWSDALDPELGLRAQRAGVHRFMRKPFSFDQLLQEVAQICSLSRTTGGQE